MVSIFTSILLLIGMIVAGYFLLKLFGTKEIFSKKQGDVDMAYSLVNACSKDDDCIPSDITPYCGCHYLVNKHIGTSDLADAVSAHRNSGEACAIQTQCQEAPNSDEIKCISGKCTSVRPTTDPAKTFSDDPDVLKQQINNLLFNANYCATADNCVVADIDAGCPFECYNLVSRNADLTWIKEGVEKYNKIQPKKCVYDCDRMPTAKEIRCVKNKCVDSRYQK